MFGEKIQHITFKKSQWQSGATEVIGKSVKNEPEDLSLCYNTYQLRNPKQMI